MAINLLGGMNKIPLNARTATFGQGIRLSSPSDVPGKTVPNTTQPGNIMSSTPGPIGVKAKNPVASVSGPSTNLPTTQKSPVQPYASAPLGNSNADLLASSTAAAQNAAKTIGGTYTQGVGYTPGPSSTGNTGSQNNPGSLYSAYVNSLGGGLQNSLNNQNAQNYTKQISTAGKGNLSVGQQAADIAAQYGKQIADVGRKGAAFESGQLTTGTSPVAQGNAAITANTAAAQQQALATGETAALAGTGQQLTAQQQAANAYNQAAGQAYTGQSQQLGALQQAAGYAQPNLGSIGQVPYSPVDLSQGSPLGAPGGTAADAAKIAGQFQGAQAVAAAPGQTQASNIQTGGTAQTGAYNTVYQNATTAAATTATQQAQIRAVGQQALGLMQSDPSINQFAAQFGNQTINALQSQLSNPKYAAFNTAIQSLRARIGAALQAGEIPTAATSNATAIANGNISLNALGSTLAQVDTELTSFVDTQNALANYAKGQFGGGSNQSGGGSYTSNSGATYTLPY